MSETYDFQTVEQKWQRAWNEAGLFVAPENPDPAKKTYLLEMFAYPSGDQLGVLGAEIEYQDTFIRSASFGMSDRW